MLCKMCCENEKMYFESETNFFLNTICSTIFSWTCLLPCPVFCSAVATPIELGQACFAHSQEIAEQNQSIWSSLKDGGFK